MTIVSLKVGGSLKKKVVGMTVRVLLHLLFFQKKTPGPVGLYISHAFKSPLQPTLSLSFSLSPPPLSDLLIDVAEISANHFIYFLKVKKRIW
jgi:hypothetical protein